MDTPPRRAPPSYKADSVPQRSQRKHTTPSSPSHQLLHELSRLHIQEQASIQARLDRDEELRAARHRAALEASVNEHNRIREVAETIRQQEELKLEIERQEKHAHEQQRLADLRREQAERLKLAEEAQRQEEDRARREAEDRESRAAAEAKRIDDAAVEAKRKEEEATAAALQKKQADEEARKKRIEEIEARAKAATVASAPKAAQPETLQPAAAAQSVVAKPATNGDANVSPDQERVHRRYLEIHQNLKDFRKWIKDEAKNKPILKQAMSSSRMLLRKIIGQLKITVSENRDKLQSVKKSFAEAMAAAGEAQVDITKFLLDPPPSSAETLVPAIYIYFLNFTSKFVFAQAKSEGTTKPEIPNALGVFTTSLFGSPDWCWNGRPMSDILIARLHRECPPLFGIYGPDTKEGRFRIGWKLVPANPSETKKTAWLAVQHHENQMHGAASLFAGLTLRNYSKSKLMNTYPQWHFWNAVAVITNIPGNEITDSHALVLSALISAHVERIFTIFGEPARLLLRQAVVAFPQKSTNQSPAVKQLALLKDKLSTEQMVQLD